MQARSEPIGRTVNGPGRVLLHMPRPRHAPLPFLLIRYRVPRLPRGLTPIGTSRRLAYTLTFSKSSGEVQP